VEFFEEYAAVPPVRASAELLEWVIENLLRNALDALEGEGEIRVSLRASSDGREVILGVADTGAGIEASDARRIFQPGYTTRRRGWGLGLALARRLVEGYGGRLRLVRSRPGEGSLFEVSLPAI
jgi:signal transduction histidine kinase